jgi:aspartate/methionine/tyrosine aminotransferase
MPSYLSIDVDGRVVRLDTFSKTVAPGCRLGWITAQPAIVERIMRITETSTQQPSGFVQSMIAELLIGPVNKGKSPKESGGWDMTGWVRWLEGLRGEYERRMNRMSDILEEGQNQVSSNRYRPAPVERSYDWAIIKNKSSSEGQTSPRYGGTISIRLKPKVPHACPTCSSPLPPSSYRAASASTSSSPSSSSAAAAAAAAAVAKASTQDSEDSWSLITSTPLFTFTRPTGGMFLWLEVQFNTHPLAHRVAGPRLSTALWIFWTTTPFRVLVSPGTIFSPTPDIAAARGWRFFRLCFAAVPADQLDSIANRFCEGIAAFWEIRDVKVIDELLKDVDFAGVDFEVLRTEGLVALTGFC